MTTEIRRPDYDESALCTQTDWLLFFPDSNPKPTKRVCRACPFLDACAEYAIQFELAGVWGANTYMERRAIRLERGLELERRPVYGPNSRPAGDAA